MSQDDIYLFLRQNATRSFTGQQIADYFGVNKSTVTTNIGKLISRGAVRFDEIYIRNSHGNCLTRMYHCDFTRDCVFMGIRKPRPVKQHMIQRQFNARDAGSYKMQQPTSGSFYNHQLY